MVLEVLRLAGARIGAIRGAHIRVRDASSQEGPGYLALASKARFARPFGDRQVTKALLHALLEARGAR